MRPQFGSLPVHSCGVCESCVDGYEQFCVQFPVLTYNEPDPILGGVTYGGYSENIVVEEAFALKVPNKSDLAGTAPLLCAGITTYSPLRHWKVGKGQKVGIVGLGGLGHLGVKFAHAFGAHVVLFTTSPGKAADPCAWVQTRSLFPATPMKCKSMPGASTLSSMLSPPSMI